MELDTEIVASVYEAAANPELWPNALSALGRLVGARGGAVVALSGSEMTFVSTTAYHQAYATYVELDKRPPNVRAQRYFAGGHLGFVPDIELCTIEELDTDPLYNAAMHPFGLGWTIGAPVVMPTADLAYIDFCRMRGEAPFGRFEAEVLDGYRPHLSRAALIATRLRLRRARAIAEALFALGIPAAVLDPSRKVVATNALFNALSPRVSVGAYDRFSIVDQAAAKLFAAALFAAPTSGHPFSIPVKATEDSPGLVIHLVSIMGSAQDVFGGSALLVAVTPVTAPAGLHTSMLMALFDLTPAEARVAREIAEGARIPQIAKKFGVSHHTVRSQLKSSMAKTGTTRQADLARLLLAVTTPTGG